MEPPPPSSSQPPPPKPRPEGGGSGGKKRQRQRRDRSQRARSQAFHDLCVELRRDSSTTVDQVRDLSRRFAELGYGIVAWNETVVGREGVRQLERAQQKKGGAGGLGGGGGGGAGIEALRLATQGAGTPARHLRRVTVVVGDPGEAQFLTGALRGLRSAGAELVAARPTSDRVLTFLCEAGDVDLISLDVRGGRAGVSLSAKQAEKAIARGLLFEVQYAGAIEECAAAAAAAAATATQQQPQQQQQQQQMRRQQVLANIGAIVAATRGRGLVWSSGAERAEWLRGPHDVMNLAVVLGLKEHQALAALTSACDAAIGHAEARCLEWLPVQVLAQPTGSSTSSRQEEPTAVPMSTDGAGKQGRGRTTGGGKIKKGRKRKGGSAAAGPTPMET